MKLPIALLLSLSTPTIFHAMEMDFAELSSETLKKITVSSPTSSQTDHQQICDAFLKKDLGAISRFIAQSSDLSQTIIYQNSHDERGEHLKLTTLLDLACEHDVPDAILQLRAAGVSIVEPDEKGDTPLARMLAKGIHNRDTIFSLITEETINTQNEKKLSPIHILLDQKRVHTAILVLLCEQGARLDIQDNAGNTPLHYAAIKDVSGKLLEYMFINSQDEEYAALLANLQNNQGSTPLHLAIERFLETPDDSDQVNTIKKLLDLGADITIENIEGITPHNLVEQSIEEENPRAQKLEAFLQQYFASDEETDENSSFWKKLFNLMHD